MAAGVMKTLVLFKAGGAGSFVGARESRRGWRRCRIVHCVFSL
jgi:hypothetical protein